jgi:AcrR family transcriptional regulator
VLNGSTLIGRSGLSRQVFYHYFSSKDELLLTMVAAGWRLVAEYIDERVAAASSPTEQLEAWIAGVMRQAQSASIRSLTTPFTCTGHRLEQRYPAEHADARCTLTRSLATIIDDGVAACVFMTDQSEADAPVIYDAVFARQNRDIVLDQLSSANDVGALSEFSLRALGALAG